MKQKQLLIIAILLINFAFSQNNQISITASCSCQQIFTEVECQGKSECSWNNVKKLCFVSSTTPTDPTTEKIVTYCDQYLTQENCTIANPCEWNGTICTHFTGCTAYTFTSNDECQKVSTRCLTDGVHCVEKAACSTYKTQAACKVNQNGRYCHWNTDETSQMKCHDVNECIQLPNTLNSDLLCRVQLDKCTAQASGGCIESGIKCEDQVSEIGCATNKDRTQACFWTQGKCYDKTCDNALLSLKTDKDCNDFLSTCTTKQGGGCVTRTTCGAVIIQAACVKDNTGGDCFWNGNKCVSKICANALTSYKTNESCQTYLSKCITNGAGCVDNTGCEAAKIKDACIKTLSGTVCHWDGTYCKVKTCQNAGPSFAGHDQCTTYMATCTANGATGCIDRTCSNAPISNNTNDLCKAYHPSGNCITKNGGGCRTNTTCEDIDVNSACVTDVNGRTCFWDGGCKLLTCVNSPSSNNTHALCQQFLSTCTVGSNSTCVEKTCENILAEADCTTDLNNKVCSYKGRCYKKYCALASKNITTHSECQQYLSTCTLDNSGYGCMPLPIKCEAITQNSACVIKLGGGKCGLQGTNCVDQTCTTTSADGSQLNTNILCNNYKTGCVVNNNLNGCMDLPSTCAARKQEANCEYEQTQSSLTDKCEWDDQTTPASPVCMDIKCETAHVVSLRGNVTQTGCWNYYNLNCIKLASATGALSCAPRPTSCTGLGQDACGQENVVVGDKNCYWDSGSLSCKDYACTSITFGNGETIDHNACYNKMNFECTINDLAVPTGCIALKSCTAYSKQGQCVKDNNGNNCFWNDNKCTYVLCSIADDSTSYDQDSECEAISNKCALIQKKCTVKKATCEEYKNESACQMHTIGGKQQCSWTSNACANTAFSCASITGIGLTVGYCQNMSKTCSVNAAGTACIDLKYFCAEYVSQANCKWAKQEKSCLYTTACQAAYLTKCYFIPKQSALECSSMKSQCSYTTGWSCTPKCENATSPYNYTTCKAFDPDCSFKFDGSGCINITVFCSDFKLVSNCSIAQEGFCYWADNTCKVAKLATLIAAGNCSSISGGQNLTIEYCQGISANSNTCSVNAAQTACIEKQDTCGGYTQAADCFYANTDRECAWSYAGAGSCKKKSLIDCSDLAGTSILICQGKRSTCSWSSGTTCTLDCTAAQGPFDYTYCQSYHSRCTVKIDGSGCVAMQNDCASTALTNCTGSITEPYCYLVGTTCTPSSTPLSTANCGTVQGTRLTSYYCQGISAGNCSVLADQSACVAIQDMCNGYLAGIQCFQAKYQANCIFSNDQCIWFDNLQNPSPCNTIQISGLITYTDYHCKIFRTTCQATANGSGCEDVVYCSTFTGTNLTLQYCMDQQIQCSVNKSKTACVRGKNTCQEYAIDDCAYALNEGECIVIGTQCVQKGCDDADSTVNTNDGCQAVSKNCILRVGGCTERVACSLYLKQADCIRNNLGEDCLWNPSTLKCVDKLCSAAEASTYFDNHAKCQAVGNCTVKANPNKTSGQGCISLQTCISYVNQQQCQISDKGVACLWVTNNPATPFCSEKSCATADYYKVDHTACSNYLAGCTVNAVDVDGVLTPKGCTTLKTCSEYKLEAQCERSSEKDLAGSYKYCVWKGDVCAEISCDTAKSTVNTPTLCAQYLTGCTVNSTNDGCVTFPDICEGMTKDQCFEGAVDSSNRKCFWLEDSNECVTKTCENSPNYANASECETYLPGCTTDAVKCKTKICEDFQFSTDALCQAASSTCTSNGSFCVTKESCAQAYTEVGCVTDIQGRLCQWMIPASGNNFCTLRTCATAPNSFTTEEQCVQYFTPSIGSCTTKKDGGCVLKGACSAATVEVACKTDNKGADCVWDAGKCRLKECKDFSGTTHAECNKISSICTVGLNGKCAMMMNCEATTVKAACIVGNNGPCLWISGYVNIDGSRGACFSYESCKSLGWQSDAQCKLISSKCTTDGTQCIGITSCAETNITGGCKTGTDGQCIQTVSAIDSKDTICKKYTSCDAAYYLTHEECYKANPNCTSDYTSGCIQLATCSTYVKPGQCAIDKNGIIKDTTGRVTSTGFCVWDSSTNTCRQQLCKDIILTSEFECSARLKTCSTDGITCIDKGNCKTYTTDSACIKAGGFEGPCFWVAATDTAAAACRTKTCADILNGNTTIVCSEVENCVSNGTNCIVRNACVNYTTKTGCQSSGTDGLCVWTEPVAPATAGKCALMTGCASAKDEITCIQASNRCSWNQITKVCAEHTCETYKAQVGSCKFFYNWDMKKYNICSTVSEKCVATDPATLPEANCYQSTVYQYSWNPSQQKCSECRSVVPNENTTNNTTKTTEVGFILAWAFSVSIGVLL